MSFSEHYYLPPRPTDSRSPCPGLNALANHGYLPRDGRNLNLLQLTRVIKEVYNFSTPLALLLAVGGVVTCGNCWKIDLHDLAKHNRIEHDGSLAHADAVPGCPFAPIAADDTRTQELLHITPAPYLTFDDFANARALRDRESSKPLDWLHTKIAYGEAVLTLKVFGEVAHGTEEDLGKEIVEFEGPSEVRVPKSYLSQWFGQDRLPDGWRKPLERVRLRSVASVSRKVAKAVRTIQQTQALP